MRSNAKSTTIVASVDRALSVITYAVETAQHYRTVWSAHVIRPNSFIVTPD